MKQHVPGRASKADLSYRRDDKDITTIVVMQLQGGISRMKQHVQCGLVKQISPIVDMIEKVDSARL